MKRVTRLIVLLGIITFIAVPISLAYASKDSGQEKQSTNPTKIDSNLAKILPQEKEVSVTVERIQRSNLETWKLWIVISPSANIKPDTKYIVRLYENKTLRDESTPVVWNKPEINVKATKDVYFTLNNQESKAYGFRDLSNIFSVKVFEVK